MRDTHERMNGVSEGFIKYIVLFVLLVVIIATFDIDVRSIVEHPFVQSVWHYIKVVLIFIRDAFGKVFGEFQTNGS